MSFRVVEPLQTGISANFLYKQVDYSAVVPSGRHIMGISSQIFLYPTSVQSIDFSSNGEDGDALRCWSRDGQLILVDISFFFTIQKEKLFEVFKNYETEWKLPLVKISKGAIKSETTGFNTTDFFTQRVKLKEAMFTAVEEKFQLEGFELLDLQLRKIDIPDSFESYVEAKQVSAQNATTELYRRNQTIVEATTVVIQEEANQEVNYWKAKAIGDANVLQAEALAQGFKFIQTAKAESYASVSNSFNLSDAQTLEYVYNAMIADRQSNIKLIVGFPKPVVSTEEDATGYVSAVQTIVTAAAAPDLAGNFTLSLGGATSGAIPSMATSDEMKIALEGMSSIGVVSVSSVATGNGNTYSVTFVSNRGSIPTLVVDSTLVTGTSASVTVSTSVEGTGPTNAVFTWN